MEKGAIPVANGEPLIAPGGAAALGGRPLIPVSVFAAELAT